MGVKKIGPSRADWNRLGRYRRRNESSVAKKAGQHLDQRNHCEIFEADCAS